MDRAYCIYQVYCYINGKSYIGYTKHYNKVLSNIRNNNFLHDFINYGKQNFSIYIISDYLTLEEAQLLRSYYISKFRTHEIYGGYNAWQSDDILGYTDNKFHPFTRKTYKGDKKWTNRNW